MPTGSRKARVAAARKAMERARQRKRRQRRAFISATIGLAVVALVVVGLAVFNRTDKPSAAPGSPTTPPATAVQGRNDQPPWPAPANTAAQVRAAGLPMLGEEGTVEHIHTHLDIIVSGQPVVVPANLGIDRSTGQLSPLHTHDTTGVLHIESPVQATFNLGQLFTEWQVSLSDNQIGGLTAGNGKVLRAYVNGKPFAGNPAGIVLRAHDEIAIVYGTPAQHANPPSSYAFPAGE